MCRSLLLVLVVATLASCSSRDREPVGGASAEPRPEPAPRAEDAATAHAGAQAFGLYVLALSWAPSFCCGHPGKQECAGLADAFAGTHLTLHGLWPNYTDAEVAGGATYPEFCGAYDHCKRSHDASCEPDPATIPDEMKVLGPGYIGDHEFLADHEWPKHGSCTGLAPAAYFRAALAAMKARPGDGTPDPLRAAIGSDVARADLERAFGLPVDSVLLSCDAHCRLSQVSFCLAHDHGVPTTPVACPRNTTTAQYDNGCVTRGCDRIEIPAPGSCEAPDPRPRHRTRRDAPGSTGRACNHPGQGPACTDDDACVKAGFVRCARSGCCTSQP